MNKYVKVASVIGLVAVMAFGATAFAFGQEATPTTAAPTTGGPGPHGPGYGVLADFRDTIDAKVAAALGMTLSDYQAALASGKSPRQLAGGKGIDQATLHAAMDAGRAEAIAQALKDGKITQAQADAMLAHKGPGGRCDGNGGGPRGPRPDGATVAPTGTQAP